MLRNWKLQSAIVAATVAIFFGTLASAQGAKHSEYGEKDLTFVSIQAQKGGDVEITFTATLESLYYCPGANAKTTKKGIELTFVRSHINSKPKVTYPRKRVKGKNGTVSVITVPAGGKDIFLRSGKNLKKLFP